MTPEQRLIFDEAAELYERSRPSYPAELVDDLGREAPAGLPALEVGAGTGKATVLMAERVQSLVALEPNHEMAAVLTRRLQAHHNVSVIESDFEAYSAPPRRFGLIFSAQAWHWLDAERRAGRAAGLLAPGGLLAAFWNRPVWGPGPLPEGLARLLDAREPQLLELPANDPRAAERPDMFEAWEQEAEGTGQLERIELRPYRWSTTYTRAAYLDLLRTQSPYRLLGAERMESLLAEIGELIERCGGEFTLPHVTWLCSARRKTPPGSAPTPRPPPAAPRASPRPPASGSRPETPP